MKTQAKQFNVQMWLVAALALSSLAGCATPLEESSRSRLSSTTGSVATTAPSALGAECSGFNATSGTLAGKVTTYYSNNALQEDRIRLRLSALDNRFIYSTTTYLQFFKWKVDSGGVAQLDSSPVQFLIEKGTSGTQPISGVISSLSGNAVQTYRINGAVPGTTAQEFFNNTVLVLIGLDNSWSAMKVVLYDGTTAIAQADVLLPIFGANPNTYAQNHPPLLFNLHPLNTQRGQTLDETDWLNRTKVNCF